MHKREKVMQSMLLGLPSEDEGDDEENDEVGQQDAMATASTVICTVPALLKNLRDKKYARTESTAVFLSRQPWRVPRSLDTLAKTLRCLPRTIILLTVSFEHVPFVDHHGRAHFQAIDSEVGLYSVNIHFGYAEPLTEVRSAVRHALRVIADEHGAEYPALSPLSRRTNRSLAAPQQTPLGFDEDSEVTYILSRMHYAIKPKHTCWTWFRASLYSLLVQNSRAPIRFFGLEGPEHRTMEIGVVRYL